MKRSLLLLSLIILFALSTAESAFAGKTPHKLQLDAYQVEVNGITYRIDPRVELFNIIAMQFGHHGMTLSNVSYKQESLEYFDAHKSHPAPQKLLRSWKNGWQVDDPMFFLLYLNEDFTIREGLHPDLIKRGGGIEHLTGLADSFRDFADTSGFYDYFHRKQKQFYEQVLSQTAYHFRNFRAKEMLEGFYGEQASAYTFILNLAGGYGNFGKSIRSENGLQLYAIVESSVSSGDLPVFKPSISGTNLILHEFSHGFVNPIVDRYAEELSGYEHLYNPIAESMRSQAYHHWQVTVNEHIVRAAVIEMCRLEFGEAYSDKLFYKLEMGKRFIYLDALLEKLKNYSNNRRQYPTFAPFVPELISVFGEINEDYISAKQEKVEHLRAPRISEIPKPNDFARDSSTVFVIPTQERDTQAQDEMHRWVEQYRQIFRMIFVPLPMSRPCKWIFPNPI